MGEKGDEDRELPDQHLVSRKDQQLQATNPNPSKRSKKRLWGWPSDVEYGDHV
jgi:hypothetical protein